MTVLRQAQGRVGVVEGPLLRKPVKFTALPAPVATTGVGVPVVSQNPKRLALLIFNAGTGNVYISTSPQVSTGDWILAAGQSLSWPGSDNPTAPLNTLFALGDAGHDLRVLETVLAPLLGTEWVA